MIRATSLAMLIAVTGMAALTVPARAAHLPMEEIPTESPLYREIEDLATRYGMPVGFASTRPWTLGDAAAYLDALTARGCNCGKDPAFVRLQREVDPDHGEPAWMKVVDDGSTIEVSPYARFGHRENDVRLPVVARDHRLGTAVAAALEPSGLLYADYYVGTFSPTPHGNPIAGTKHSIVEGVEVNVWFDRAFLAAGGRRLSARVGHTWLRWGPGLSGTLGLYDGSLALDLAELRWRVLPAAQITSFVAVLDAFEESYLAGHRLELRLGSALDLGASELARFNGSGQVPLYLFPLIGYNLREKQISRFSNTTSDTANVRAKNNVMWTFDATWRPTAGWATYGEVTIDDYSLSSDYRPDEIGYQLGTRHSQRIGDRDAASARFEYTRVNNFTYSTWHHHDFKSDGFPLAYPFGPDVEVWGGQLGWDRGSDWTVALAAWRILKGEGDLGKPWLPSQGHADAGTLSGVIERTTRASFAVGYRPGRRFSVTGETGWNGASDRGHVSGAEANRWFGALTADVRW